jgi:hypothetical protein
MPIRDRRNPVHSLSDRLCVGRPSRNRFPDVGASSPATMFNSVLFPHPLGPINAQNSPAAT